MVAGPSLASLGRAPDRGCLRIAAMCLRFIQSQIAMDSYLALPIRKDSNNLIPIRIRERLSHLSYLCLRPRTRLI